MIVAGHGRVLAAQRLGLAEVPVIVLAHLSEAQRRALVIADNRITENAGWGEAMLRAELAALRVDAFDLDLLGFAEEELGRLLDGLDADIGDDGTAGGETSPDALNENISALYSPVGWRSWAALARDRIAAGGNDAALKTFMNTDLGETWQERGEAPDWQRLYDRREDREAGTVPAGGLILTAGADVQHDRIEVDVWTWGRRLESHLVEHVVLEGDTSREEAWKALTALLGRTWRHEDGARMPISRLAIDSGDGRNTAAVYAWVRRAGAGQALAVKGAEGFDRSTPVDGPTRSMFLSQKWKPLLRQEHARDIHFERFLVIRLIQPDGKRSVSM